MVHAQPVKDWDNVYRLIWKLLFLIDLSINEGGIAPLGEEREAYVFRQVQEIAKKNKIHLDKTFKRPAEKITEYFIIWKRRR